MLVLLIKKKKTEPPDLLSFNATNTEEKQQPNGWTQFGEDKSSSSVSTTKTTTTTTTTNSDLGDLLGISAPSDEIRSQKSGEDTFGESESSNDSLFGMTAEQKQKKLEPSKNSILDKFKDNKAQTMQRTRSQPISNQDFLTQLPQTNFGGGMPNQQVMGSPVIMPSPQIQMNPYGMPLNNGYVVNSNPSPYTNLNMFANTTMTPYNQPSYPGTMNSAPNSWGFQQMNGGFNGMQPSNRTQNQWS